MTGIATDGAKTSGHEQFPPTTVTATSTKVFANGKKIVLNGDSIVPHTRLVKPFDTHTGTVQASSTKVFVEGKPIGRIGDPISCGDTIAQGESNISAS